MCSRGAADGRFADPQRCPIGQISLLRTRRAGGNGEAKAKCSQGGYRTDHNLHHRIIGKGRPMQQGSLADRWKRLRNHVILASNSAHKRCLSDRAILL